MSRVNRTVKLFGMYAVTVALVVMIASFGFSFVPAFAQQSGPASFDSPEAAAKAFFEAAQSGSDQALLRVLGPEGKEIITAGDNTEDFDARTGFVLKYEEMHRLSKKKDGSVVLVVGAENWPLPLPIVKKNGTWEFDTKAGKAEILYRRIGENEVSAIQACDELVAAQKQYFAQVDGGASKQYAQKIFSDKGTHDGLYWVEADEKAAGDLDRSIALASGWPQGKGGNRVPYNGYFFRVLTQQGPQAAGGAKNYVDNGKMTGGFAFVAYPAEYRSSGVMTFIVNNDGIVFEKDLGSDTTKQADATVAFNPDSSWRKVN